METIDDVNKGSARPRAGLPPPDISSGAQEYLIFQAKQLGLPRFDVLVVSSLIFCGKKVLLVRLSKAVKSWKGKVGPPILRVLTDGEHGLEALLRSPIDKAMAEADEVSVEEYSRVATRIQVGLEPRDLRNSKAGTALLTAVSPGGLDDTIWLRASLLWRVGEERAPQVDGHVCEESWWASEEEVEHRADDDFYFGLKDDILKAFSLAGL
jgi:hypothetical protein